MDGIKIRIRKRPRIRIYNVGSLEDMERLITNY